MSLDLLKEKFGVSKSTDNKKVDKKKLNEMFNSNPMGKLESFKTQHQGELQEKDRIIESLKAETSNLANQVLNLEKDKSDLLNELNQSKWLENTIASNTKKLYEDKIKKMNIVDSTKLIPLLIEVSRQKQGNIKLNWGKWLETPENIYLFKINESIARKVFEDTNLLIDEKINYINKKRRTYVGDAENYALSFTGDRSGATKTFLSTTFNPDNYSLWNGFTLSLWVRPDEVMDQQATILGTRANSPVARFHIGIAGSSGNITLGVGGTEMNGINNPMEVGKWHHLLVTYAGDDKGLNERKLRMWVDNDPRITDKDNILWGAQDEATETYTHSIFMGGRNTEAANGYSQGFACAIDEVAIYNTGFDTDGTFANEVYNAGFGYDHRKNNNLVGYWRFDEGSGTTVKDLSGNNNHGTLTTDGSGLPTWEKIERYA